MATGKQPPTTKLEGWQDARGAFAFTLAAALPTFRAFMLYEDNPVSIKYYVKRYIQQHRPDFTGKVAIDSPAGSGTTSKALREAGAEVHAYDLFPEYFTTKGMICER